MGTILKKPPLIARASRPRSASLTLSFLAVTLAIPMAGLLPVLSQNLPERPAPPRTAPQTDLRRYVPSTISDVWRQIYAAYPDPTTAATMPGLNDIKGWKRMFDGAEQGRLQQAEEAVKTFQVSVASKTMGGVPVLEITPKGWMNDGNLLLYTHGGAYTFFSARTTLPNAALVAAHTGMRVISVDYTNPPRARWQTVTDQVVRVFRALMLQGFTMKNLAIYGDSSGGGLAAGAVLKLRDAGLGMPAAVVLWSPWADITETGDTYVTLKAAEPTYLYEKLLGPSANAYADRKDQKSPYVSPVYGDFTQGFPPTLIQGGTREIFLSNFVRLYQALDTTGQTVTLDLYEGLPHVFQILAPQAPESVTALKKMDAFLARHLKK